MASSSSDESEEDSSLQTDSDSDFDLSYIDVNNIQPYMFEPMAASGDEEEEKDENTERIGNVEWCSCGQCIPMTTGKESLCCMEVQKAGEKLKNSGKTCIVEEEEFQTVCTHPAVIKTAKLVFHKAKGTSPVSSEDVAFRRIAYQQWTAWIYESLKSKYRLPAPCCVVDKIRQAFPSPTNTYTGYECLFV